MELDKAIEPNIIIKSLLESRTQCTESVHLVVCEKQCSPGCTESTTLYGVTPRVCGNVERT